MPGYMEGQILKEMNKKLLFTENEVPAKNQIREEDPILNPEQSPAAQIEKMSRESGRKTVLVVDDDVTMLSAIKRHLEGLYDVAMVPSGKLALKYLEKKKADLVLLDYMMPDQDGPTVLRQIRLNSSSPDIPVIFLTGVSERDAVIKGLEFHPAGYLLKPIDPFTLLEKVTEVILELQ